MKKIFIAVLAVLSVVVHSASAQQKDSLSFDERDKYIYYQVADQPELNNDSLYNRALHFLKEAFEAEKLKFDKQDKSKGTLTGKGGFMVTKKALVSNNPDAKIAYKMTIEVKEGKYRYWLTDFEVIPYKRDRYADFSPSGGKSIPLEQGLRKLGDKTLDDYLEKVLLNCRNIGGVLKSFMARPSGVTKDTPIKKTVTTKEW